MTNPDRAKATESPDGSGLIKEALAALDHLPGQTAGAPSCCVYAHTTIRSALATAAQEDAAWREIEAWLAVDTERDFVFSPSCMQAGKWVSRLVDGDGAPRYGEPDSRLAALVAAGEYCRAERSKAG